ncbi:MAG: hypothetical protein SGJ27_05530 [Candidatus Melainabacteria bacterium]|mgnify:CR=1 FL=1|nr:hypothetical protein [Candidatus Melainabacteria bacterium]
MKRNNFVKTVLVAALALPLLLTTACGSHSVLDEESGYARQLDSQLLLAHDGQKEMRREVEYWSGSRNLKQVTVFYRAGGKQIAVYRNNGTVRLLTEWYPEPALTVAPPREVAANPAVFSGPGAGILPGIQTAEQAQATAGSAKIYDPPTKFGKVKRSIEYGDNGKSIVRASFFREDGSLSAYGRTVGGTDFELVDYTRDGRTIARKQQFTQSGDLFYMQVVVGAPTNIMVAKLLNRTEQTTTFGADGLRVSRSTKPLYGTEEIEFYRADGKALRLIVYRSYMIEALYFRDDGTVESFRSFGADGSITVTKYRDNCSTKKPESVDGASPCEDYRQYWQAKKDASGKVTYELTRLDEIATNGRMSRRLMFRAGKLTFVDYFHPSGDFDKVLTLRPDQTVEQMRTYSYPPGGVVTSAVTEVAIEKNMRESYDSKLLELAPVEDVRNLVEPLATPPWNGYEGYDY